MGLLSYGIHKHLCRSQHIFVLTTWTFYALTSLHHWTCFFNTASGMHRRPFKGRHLVVYFGYHWCFVFILFFQVQIQLSIKQQSYEQQTTKMDAIEQKMHASHTYTWCCTKKSIVLHVRCLCVTQVCHVTVSASTQLLIALLADKYCYLHQYWQHSWEKNSLFSTVAEMYNKYFLCLELFAGPSRRIIMRNVLFLEIWKEERRLIQATIKGPINRATARVQISAQLFLLGPHVNKFLGIIFLFRYFDARVII